MRYAGIDASPRRVAIFVVGPRGGHLAHLYLEFAADDDIGKLKHTLTMLNRERADGLCVTIEGAYLGPNKRGSLNQAELVGTLKGGLLSGGHEVATMLPAEWRSLCGITGRGKQPIMDWASDRYGAIITNQDLADASAIAYAAAQKGESK